MPHIDNPNIYDPYQWRLAELAAPAVTEQRRDELLDDLIVWEAEEIAHGYQHVTVVHANPTTIDGCDHLDAFYDTLRTLTARQRWVRARGTADHVTITARGTSASELIDAIINAANLSDLGHWQITTSPYPPIPRTTDHP